jgi:hypothetical protein
MRSYDKDCIFLNRREMNIVPFGTWQWWYRCMMSMMYNIGNHYKDYILMMYIICDKNIFVQSPNFVYGSSFVCDHQNCNHYMTSHILHHTQHTINGTSIGSLSKLDKKKYFWKYHHHHHHHPCIPSKIGSFYTYRIKIWSYDAKYEMPIQWLHFT